MLLTLIRHTKVDVPAGFIYGQTDVPLNGSFELESAEVVKKVDGQSFDAIFSSPLSRCMKLALKIAGDLPVQTDNRFLELNFGIWEGNYWSEVETTIDAQNWFNNYLNVACPGGESYADLICRVQQFIIDLKKCNYKSCCVVAHAGSIRAMLSIIENWSPEEAFNRNLEYGEVIKLSL